MYMYIYFCIYNYVQDFIFNRLSPDSDLDLDLAKGAGSTVQVAVRGARPGGKENPFFSLLDQPPL